VPLNPPEPRPAADELVARAEALRPVLLEEQAATEKRTFYSEQVHERFRQAGFYRILQPRRYGGFELDVATYYRVMAEVARGCPSTGWCLALASAHVLQVAAFFSEEAQDETFGPDGEFRAPFRALPGGTARRADGGYLVKGTWDYCSGVPYATHFVGMALLEGAPAGNPPTAVVMLPRGRWEMLDDWGDILGLRGSGSHSVAVPETLVDERFVVPVLLHDVDVTNGTPGLRLHGNPMYAGRYLAFFGAELASVMVGAARAAIDEYERVTRAKTTTFPPVVPRHLHPDFQRPLGEALGLVDTAEAAVLHVGRRYMELCARGAAGGEPFSREEDLRLHAVASRAGRLAWEAVDLLARKAGTTAAAKDGQRMQRYLRDVSTYRSHHESTQFEAHATMLGRVRFGLPMWEEA
jgi:3-hydroxy-9,10-secoandrosta-1,3,5(10)-triene-9,17-dione monooxygenase